MSAEIDASSVPVIGEEVFDLIAQGCIPGGSRDNLAYANEFTEWDGTSNIQKALLTDAQTSGGLLLCVPQKHLPAVLKLLKARRALAAATIGRIVRGHETANTSSCMNASRLRAIPSVEKVLQSLGDAGLPRPLVLDQVRRELGALRKQKAIPEFDAVVSAIRARLRNLSRRPHPACDQRHRNSDTHQFWARSARARSDRETESHRIQLQQS